MKIDIHPIGAAVTADQRRERWIFKLSCPDRLGIVAAVAGVMRDSGANIIESAQFGDAMTNRFFMRMCVEVDPQALPALMRRFRHATAGFDMAMEVFAKAYRPRTLVMVSRESHCLFDLLYRREIGELAADVVLVGSNHEVLRNAVETNGLPFFHVSNQAADKAEAERRIRDMIELYSIELIVLARYMQILSADFCRDFEGRIINIHHSFLPSFVGAKPYHQAFERGVKLIGATAHFVTAELDAGPIIEQKTIRVDHATDVTAMIQRGRDIEASVLTRALTWVAEGRVLLNGGKTVLL